MTADRRQRADEADDLLQLLLAKACDALGTTTEGIALVGVGGYGRRELSPYSDLDVMLVHDPAYPRLDDVARSVWYPLWDARTRLDHSVRTVDEARAAAADDVRVALGLLDARHVAGDPSLTLRLRSVLMADWRRGARTRLPELAEACRERASSVGELAHLAEPELKEAYGGLRDAVVLRALVASWLVDVPHPVVERARRDLLEVRDVLHTVAGRATDRLVAEYAGDVARTLGLDGRDELLRHVYATGRALAHVCDVSWRRVASLSARRPGPRRLSGGPLLVAIDEGVAAHEGEVVLLSGVRPARDPLIALRTASVAAERGLGLSPAVCARLTSETASLPEPWPSEARRLLCATIGAGPGLLEVWEALDQAGYVARLLPEWDGIRFRPPQSPVHRFTVDRHSLETCVEAAASVRDVRRPDLLLVAALLHDIGKGKPGDHSVNGARIARRVCTRWGFSAHDVDVIDRLVRAHLLLAETATRRDLDDPMTVDLVADVVGDTETLDLLEALTYADARAAGPVASSTWRLRLVADLARRVRARLGGGSSAWADPVSLSVPPLGPGSVGVEVSASAEDGAIELVVAVPDRIGALAVVAGVLAVERLRIRSATVATAPDALGLSQWVVAGSAPPDPVRLRERLAVALRDDTDLVRRLAARDATAVPSHAAAPRVDVLADVSDSATVVQVRAHDRPGLVYDVCSAIAAAGADVRSAHVTTLGAECVDVFYVTGASETPLDETQTTVLLKTLQSRLTSV